MGIIAGKITPILQMRYKRHYPFLLSFNIAVLLLSGQVITYATPLTLRQAEAIALSQSPEVRALQAKSNALSQSAIAAGQLSDTKLMLNAMNVPVDTFDLSQEPMTQLQLGFMQTFPRGRSLHYRSMQKANLSVANSQQQRVMCLQVLRSVRLSWLNLYYWQHARNVVLKQKQVFQHLVKVTESMLANNKAGQQDVIRAQLELTELDNRLLIIHQQIDTARAALSRWIGATLSKAASPRQLPSWSSPPTLAAFYAAIRQHPTLKTDAALIASGQSGVHLAEQQYKPGFSVSVAYGFRQGHNMDGQKRADFLSAQLSMDLPLFTYNRQDRTLKASQASLLADEDDQMSHYRQLNEILKTQYATWQQQRRSVWLYQSRLVPEARQYAEATLTAYQNTQTDFPTLARAYVRELDTELAGLKARVYQAIARIHLLYLQGQ